MTNGGQQYAFGARLNRTYGDGAAERIISKGNEKHKFTVNELRELLIKYDRQE